MEIIATKKIPRKILVFTIASMSRPFEIFVENICVTISTDTTKTPNISKEKVPVIDVTMKNQNDNPVVTARDLNLGDDSSILNWIDECYKS